MRARLFVVKITIDLAGRCSSPSSHIASACSVMRSASLMITTFHPEPPSGVSRSDRSTDSTALPSWVPDGISVSPPKSPAQPRSAARASAAAVLPTPGAPAKINAAGAGALENARRASTIGFWPMTADRVAGRYLATSDIPPRDGWAIGTLGAPLDGLSAGGIVEPAASSGTCRRLLWLFGIGGFGPVGAAADIGAE
jgi:hypothetical protein